MRRGFHGTRQLQMIVCVVAFFTVINVILLYLSFEIPVTSTMTTKQTERPQTEKLQRAAQNTENESLSLPSLFAFNRTVWQYESMEEMLEKRVPSEFWGPKLEDQRLGQAAAEIVKHSGCDIVHVPFDPTKDAECTRYLGIFAEWTNVKPLSAIYDERTIKFEVTFRAGVADDDASSESHLHALVKVPQRLFPHEAFSEVGAFHADRIMNINRIPPTAWICIPVGILREAIKKHAADTAADPDILADSRMKSYADWVGRDFFEYAQKEGLLRSSENDGGDGEKCIGASIQVKVADVYHLLDSALAIPYIPHNASWMRFFNFSNEGGFPSWYTKGKLWSITLIHISEITTFDYIIGNDDRSPNKNNFVVGGCVRHGRCHSRRHRLKHPRYPTFIHLDQGMGFYPYLERNAIYKSRKHQKIYGIMNSFCLFRVPLLKRLQFLAKPVVEGGEEETISVFHSSMVERMELELQQLIPSKTLRACTKRMLQVLELGTQCLESPMRSLAMAP